MPSDTAARAAASPTSATAAWRWSGRGRCSCRGDPRRRVRFPGCCLLLDGPGGRVDRPCRNALASTRFGCRLGVLVTDVLDRFGNGPGCRCLLSGGLLSSTRGLDILTLDSIKLRLKPRHGGPHVLSHSSSDLVVKVRTVDRQIKTNRADGRGHRLKLARWGATSRTRCSPLPAPSIPFRTARHLR